ncbi:hypothetical protein ACI3L3_16830 [Desulfobaculum sp. SPO524]|uniref:hypothetical protein n=1 Tax=Desulfobaculum sp. SPO524 TaxID=3378071 RepID=UPI003853C6A4
MFNNEMLLGGRMWRCFLLVVILFFVAGCGAEPQYGRESFCSVDVKRQGNVFWGRIGGEKIDFVKVNPKYSFYGHNKVDYNNVYAFTDGVSVVGVTDMFGYSERKHTYKFYQNSQKNDSCEFVSIEKGAVEDLIDYVIVAKKNETGEYICVYYAYHENVDSGWLNMDAQYGEPLALSFRYSTWPEMNNDKKRYVQEVKARADDSVAFFSNREVSNTKRIGCERERD